MYTEILHGIAGARDARGLVVIIDVFRAFSTACYAVDRGAREIVPVGDLDTARRLKQEEPGAVLMGERCGVMQIGFDYGNSPTEILGSDLRGRRVIQTTSAGTQGFAKAKKAKILISGSFVNAGAVIRYIHLQAPRRVSLVCMGTAGVKPNAEDSLCAEYIRDTLADKPANFDILASRIRRAPSARKFFDPAQACFPETDVNLCLRLNAFDFVLVAERDAHAPMRLVPLSVSSRQTRPQPAST